MDALTNKPSLTSSVSLDFVKWLLVSVDFIFETLPYI